ncbi:hypothetical protein HYH02_013823 [Chlamydomonas schloesseri]|uniref:Phosphatidylinositol-specific phospholipase C X domain-containing protein n=1 Tax=Chlamydomonas schloesseri TaxID=2026947 RepID=A0A835T103_9CHLO|nr:hypothetical protein HYH02_013823 [Chlamydomonas schloesseri]|eukprot:KAG2429995.1 hypothetical protein HYH02_013823 [Chlamydomonas schloesseri]
MEWMHDSYELLADRRLDQLLLPGTHDSAAHTLTAEQPLGDSASDRFLAWLAGAFPSAVAPWTLTQHATVYEQLCAGVRFLDVRVAWSPPQNPGGRGAPARAAGDGGAFWCSHTFACQPLKAVLQAVADFLAATTHEVVVLALRPDWPHRAAFTRQPGLGARLAAAVADGLRGSMYPPPPPPPLPPPTTTTTQQQQEQQEHVPLRLPSGEELGRGCTARDTNQGPAAATATATATTAAASSAGGGGGGLQLPTLRAMVDSGRRVLVFFDAPRAAAPDAGVPEQSQERSWPPRRHPLQQPLPQARAQQQSAMGAPGLHGPGAERREHGGDRTAADDGSTPVAAANAPCCCGALRLPWHCPPDDQGPGAAGCSRVTVAASGPRLNHHRHGSSSKRAGCIHDSYGCKSSPHALGPHDRLWLGSLCRPLWAQSSSAEGTITGLLQLLMDARRRPLGPGPCWHAAAAATPTPSSVVRDVLRYGPAAAGLRRLAAELEAAELPRLLAAPAPAPGFEVVAAPDIEFVAAPAAASGETALAPGASAAQLVQREEEREVTSHAAGLEPRRNGVAGCSGRGCAASGSGGSRGGCGGGGGPRPKGAADTGGAECRGSPWSGPGGLLRWGRAFAVCLDHPSPAALESIWRLNLQPLQPPLLL